MHHGEHSGTDPVVHASSPAGEQCRRRVIVHSDQGTVRSIRGALHGSGTESGLTRHRQLWRVRHHSRGSLSKVISGLLSHLH